MAIKFIWKNRLMSNWGRFFFGQKFFIVKNRIKHPLTTDDKTNVINKIFVLKYSLILAFIF